MLPIVKVDCWQTINHEKFFTLKEAEDYTKKYLSETRVNNIYKHDLLPGNIALYSHISKVCPEENHSYKVQVIKEIIYSEWLYDRELKKICLTDYNILYTKVLSNKYDDKEWDQAFHTNAISCLTKL